MLVLTREKDEVIHIGDAVQVVVLAIQGCRVKLGIAAPREVAIRRIGASDEFQAVAPAWSGPAK